MELHGLIVGGRAAVLLRLVIESAKHGMARGEWLRDQFVGTRQVVRSRATKKSGYRYGGDGHPGCTCRSKMMSTGWTMSELRGAGRRRRRPTTRQYQVRHTLIDAAAAMEGSQKGMMTRRKSNEKAMQMARTSGALQIVQLLLHSVVGLGREIQRSMHVQFEGEVIRLGQRRDSSRGAMHSIGLWTTVELTVRQEDVGSPQFEGPLGGLGRAPSQGGRARRRSSTQETRTSAYR